MPPRRRRARPVADAPIDALLPRSEDLAKGWLLALLEQAPLDDAPAILATQLTRDGPRVCDAVLRAIADDTDLCRLEPGGAFTPLAARVGELAGASAPSAVSRAVDALIGVIWAAVRDELRGADADLVSELMERLALIGELVRSTALDHAASPRIHSEPPRIHSVPPRIYSVPPPEPPAPSPRSWPGLSDMSTLDPSRALWVGALEDEITRSAGGALSLLLTELEDAQRVAAVEPHAPARAAFTGFAGAVRSAVRRQDILVCESDARAWVIARDTGRDGASRWASGSPRRSAGQRVGSETAAICVVPSMPRALPVATVRSQSAPLA